MLDHMDPTIRRATALDALAIQNLVKSVYGEYGFSWDPDGYHADLYADFEQTYFEPNGAYWVAQVGEKIVGGGGVVRRSCHAGPTGTLVPSEDGLLVVAGADCEVMRMYILADQRGNGIGKLIFAEVLAWARSQDCRLLEIWSDIELTTAHPFYERMGAQRVGQRKCNDPDEAEEYGFYLGL